jgi:hypothetical protein
VYPYRRAINRGFNLKPSPLVLNTHVDDATRLNRLSKQTKDTKNLILEKVRRNRYSRELSSFNTLILIISLTLLFLIGSRGVTAPITP